MNNQKRYRAFGVYIAVIIILALLWILRDNSSGFGQNSVYTSMIWRMKMWYLLSFPRIGKCQAERQA